MIRRKTQAAIIKNHLQSVKRNLLSFKKRRDARSLHDLRVAIKKIRAVLLLQPGSERSALMTEKLDELFSRAGKIRQMQVAEQLLSGYIPGVSVRLRAGITKSSARFVKSIPTYIHAVERCLNRDVLHLEDTRTKRCLKVIRKLERSAKKNFFSGDTEGLHQARKKLKRLMYLHAAYGKVKNFPSLGRIRKMDHLQEQIGTLHDISMLRALLKDYKAADRKLQRKLASDERTLIKKIRTLGKNYFALTEDENF